MDEGNAACGQLHSEISIPDAWRKVHALRNTGASKHEYATQSSVSHHDLIAQNPFRTPEVLERTKASRLRAMQQSARGPKFLYVDIKIYMWLGQWLLLPLLYYSTPLGASIRSAMGSTVVSTAWTLDHIHTLALLFTLATFATVYRSLYASDPGFLGSESDAKHLQMDPELAFACPYCGSRPTTRSKHSKVSGQCVHKFDHSCWLLSTDIGDRNHGIFWVYLVLQVGLILWCLRLQMQAILACFDSMHAMQGLTGCGLSGTPHAFLLGAGFLFTAVSLLPFGYLLLLHTYLLATDQTTCEVVKGAKCAYLAPYFEGTCSTKYHLPEDLHVLLWNEMQGRGPPKPFSQGVWNNVVAQITTAWPRQYVARPP